MAVSYKKLWKLLIDTDMKKKDLRIATGMTTTALAKLGKNEHVNTEILAKICKVLECNIEDIIEIIDEGQFNHMAKYHYVSQLIISVSF